MLIIQTLFWIFRLGWGVGRVFGIVSGQVVLFCFLLAAVLLAFFGSLLFTSCVLLALFVLYNICFLLIKKKKGATTVTHIFPRQKFGLFPLQPLRGPSNSYISLIYGARFQMGGSRRG